MSLSQPNSTKTQVWIDGEPVVFVTWTNKELIYTREGFKDTLIRLPRRTVQRMLKKGTLRLEGFRPSWATADEADPAASDPTSTTR